MTSPLRSSLLKFCKWTTNSMQYSYYEKEERKACSKGPSWRSEDQPTWLQPWCEFADQKRWRYVYVPYVVWLNPKLNWKSLLKRLRQRPEDGTCPTLCARVYATRCGTSHSECVTCWLVASLLWGNVVKSHKNKIVPATLQRNELRARV